MGKRHVRIDYIFITLEHLRGTIISMDLSYSQTRKLLDLILEAEHAVDDLLKIVEVKDGSQSN